MSSAVDVNLFQLLASGELDGLELSDEELAILSWHSELFYVRSDQRAPDEPWDMLTYICGRGWGKSWAIAWQINAWVDEGRHRNIALAAQDDERTMTLQVQPLIDSAPPWNRCRMFNDQLRWDNGAVATLYTPEAPEKMRGGSLDLTWLSEVVAWAPATRWDAFANITTATRVGLARVIVDTTSKGRNEIIEYLIRQNATDPKRYPLIRGRIGDNYMHGREYLKREYAKYNGRRLLEELEGATFSEVDGSAFSQDKIDEHRVSVSPRMVRRLIGLDPGVSTDEGVDGTGLILLGEDSSNHYYVERDASAILEPERYAEQVFRWHAEGAGIVALETNKGGRTIFALLKAYGQSRSPAVEVRLLLDGAALPPYSSHILYVREIHSRSDKLTRSLGAAQLINEGRIHFVGKHADLERQLCTYDGTGKSPNNFDAFVHGINTLARLTDARGRLTDARAADGNRVANNEVNRRLQAIKRSRSVL